MTEALKAQLLYLKQDIESLQKLREDITESVNDVESSGLTNFYLTNLKARSLCLNREYVTSLELIINTVYVLLLDINAIYDLSKGKQLISHRNVVRPRFMLFGKIINTLWSNVKGTTRVERKGFKLFVANEDEGMADSSSHKQTQTSESTRDKCDSCFIAETCIKKIMFSIQSELSLSFIIQDTQTASDRKFEVDITQQGAMMRITNSLENYIFCLLDTVEVKAQEIEFTKHASDELNANLLEIKTHNFTLKESYDRMKMKLAERESAITKLTAERDKLQYKFKEYRKEVGILRKQVDDYMKSIKFYEKLVSNHLIETDKWMRIFREEKSSLFINYIQRIERLNCNITETDSNIAELMEGLRYMTSSIDVLCSSTDKITRICQGIDLRVMDLIDKCSLSNYVKTLFNKCQDVVNISQGEDANIRQNSNGSPKFAKPPPYKLLGDPVKDISGQIENNKKQIQVLEEQNLKLQNLVDILNKRIK